MTDDNRSDAPEATNTSQQDGPQAQDIAAEALADAPSRAGDRGGDQDSEHGGGTPAAQLRPDDAQDVVDHMEQMARSGRIDADAYRGERNDGDEEDPLGSLDPDETDGDDEKGGAGYGNHG